MNKCPCKGCADRMLMCHTICRSYKAWKAENEAMEAARRAEQEHLRPLPRKALLAWFRKMKQKR